jgi:TB2/DP1, HVA22 family
MYRLGRIAMMAWLVAPQTRGATMVYQTYARPIFLALLDKARDIPALEPYTRGIGSPISQLTKKTEGAVPDAKESYAPLKAHAT